MHISPVLVHNKNNMLPRMKFILRGLGIKNRCWQTYSTTLKSSRPLNSLHHFWIWRNSSEYSKTWYKLPLLINEMNLLFQSFFYEELRIIWCYFFIFSILVDLYMQCIHTVTMLKAQWLHRFEN